MAADPASAQARSRATDRPGDTSPFALGLALRRAHWRAAAVMSEALRPLGVELRHFAVLIALADRGPTVQGDLASTAGTDKAGVVRIVDDLERGGLAARKAHPQDRRSRLVEITPKGIDLFDTAHGPAQPLAEHLTAELDPGEFEHLMDMLNRLAHPQHKQ